MSVMWKGRNVVLASGSPRRRELLAQVGMEPEIVWISLRVRCAQL